MTQDAAYNICKTGANVFLTGEPGSGKTHTVNRYVKYLRSHAIEPAITASTGIAATHIGGMTIHSWSGIGIKDKLSTQDLNTIASRNYIEKRIKKTNVLIIDEISMLGANSLSMVDLVCKKIKGNEKPFGGIQVVLVGDFFQLPPIANRGEKSLFAFESKIWDELNLSICYITEQHRQDDDQFLSVLTAMRSGNVEEEHFAHITNRMNQKQDDSLEITKLFSHNADVDRINSARLDQIESKAFDFNMTSFGKRKVVDTLKKGCISPEQLTLKVGAVVMFTKNNPAQGFVNGTLGKVIDFDDEFGRPVVQIRNKIVIAEPMEWMIEENGMILASISQIPLRLAWAITIHKSQGMSMDAAVMDLSRVFEYGQGYVALSRVRRLKGLYLLGCNNNALLVHPDIIVKDKEFRLLSDKTMDKFSSISKDDLLVLYENFITKCGGSIKKQDVKDPKRVADKANTFDETLSLIQDKKTINEIVSIRKLTFGTVLSHLERLLLEKKIEQSDVKKMIKPLMKRSLKTIQKAFSDLDTDKLSPVRSKLKNKFSFDEIRLARMLIEK